MAVVQKNFVSLIHILKKLVVCPFYILYVLDIAIFDLLECLVSRCGLGSLLCIFTYLGTTN